MFHSIVNSCYPQTIKQGKEVVEAPTTGGQAAKVLDAISGIALVIVGSLVAAGFLSKLSPVAAYAMIGIGAFQLNHLVSKMLEGAANRIHDLRACCAKSQYEEMQTQYKEGNV